MDYNVFTYFCYSFRYKRFATRTVREKRKRFNNHVPCDVATDDVWRTVRDQNVGPQTAESQCHPSDYVRTYNIKNCLQTEKTTIGRGGFERSSPTTTAIIYNILEKLPKILVQTVRVDVNEIFIKCFVKKLVYFNAN